MPVPAVGPVKGVSFSPDNRLLFILNFPPIANVVDVASGRLVRKILLPTPAITAASSPDGNTLAVGLPGEVGLWHIPTGLQMGSLPLTGAADVLLDLHFSPDGRKLGAIARSSDDMTDLTSNAADRAEQATDKSTGGSDQVSVYIWQLD